MSVPKIYLCGPILGRTDEDCIDWRARATTLLEPLDTLNPIRRDYRGKENNPEIIHKIVEDDEDDIRNSAALLVMYDKPSIGTSMEIRMAFKEVKIPVFVVDISGQPRSPWLVYHSTIFFTDLESACVYIRDWIK